MDEPSSLKAPVGTPASSSGHTDERFFRQAPASANPQPPRARLSQRLLHGIKFFLPDALFLFVSHRRRVGRFPNIRRPSTFNEQILQRCLHPDPRFAPLTDKLEVRSYVERKLGNAHLIPLIAVPERFTQDVFDALPPAFVMKANHGSGFVEIVRDKSSTSFEALRRLAEQWLSINFYHASRERHYRDIEPRIYFEELLLDRSGKIPADLKFHCFSNGSGHPTIYVVVISDRFGDARGDMYDVQWNHLDVAVGDYRCSDFAQPRPPTLAALIETATLLSEEFNYVRVDLYAQDDRIYFGELTFTPGAGVFPFTPHSVDSRWGELFKAAKARQPEPAKSI
jgi:TupA-like ATPgrasp